MASAFAAKLAKIQAASAPAAMSSTTTVRTTVEERRFSAA